MAEFKFVCRETEIEETVSSLRYNLLVLLHSQSNSGLTHFLKKMMQLLWCDNSICFYIDKESTLKISNQIVGQVAFFSKNDSSEQNAVSKLLRRPNKGNIVFAVVTSCLYALDAIPLLPDIGTIANSLLTAIKETVDADYEHLRDFKTEKAITKFFEILTRKQGKQIYLLIDNPHYLNAEDISFLTLLVERYQTHILFAFNSQNYINEIELISKMSSQTDATNRKLDRIKSEFKRPDDMLIKALYQCYGKELPPSAISLFEKTERNIHIIMANILGIPIDICQVDAQLQYLLKVLYVLNCPVPKSILFSVLRMENLHSLDCSDNDFHLLCNRAIEQGFLKVGHLTESTYELNLTNFYGSNFSISFAEKQKIIGDAINAMDRIKDSLSIPLLEFAISNLEHDYTHCKQFILALTRIQYKQNRVNLAYLNKLYYFDDAEELFFICGIYYDHGIYDKPYHLLQTHKNFSRKQAYKLMQALVCERLHINNYVQKLEDLFKHTVVREKKCLLAAVLFVAYLNSDYTTKYKRFFNQESEYYYKLFEGCKNYHYLLRNITYYIEDVQEAMSNYEKCLDCFRSKDPVNYNRTISNYLCYLMRHDSSGDAMSRMVSAATEVQKILEYNDVAYSYLNNNYGIYLMRYTDEDPTTYFSSIGYSSGTTETPYIYAQINLALYHARTNPRYALMIMNTIEEKVQQTSVPRTKQFYNINRALIEFVNGQFPQTQLNEILEKPLRGNIEYAQSLCNRYLSLQTSGQVVDAVQYKALSLPGYLFYRYFSAEKLLSSF